MRTIIPLLIVVAACGGKVKEIDSPEIESSSKQAATQSSDVGNMPAESDESTITANVQALGSSFQAIQTQHQAYAAASAARLAPSSTASLGKAEEGEVLWDGTNLSMNWSYDDGSSFAMTYLVELTFAAQAAGGYVIDGTYDLSYDASAFGSGIKYDINVIYNALTVDGDGCGISGSLDISYDYRVEALGIAIPGMGGATDLSGRVVTTFNGCDDVTVEGS